MNFKPEKANLFVYFFVILVNTVLNKETARTDEGTCSNDQGLGEITCQSETKTDLLSGLHKNDKKYILYDVNAGEGFNLRRDVYLRMAGLVRQLIKEKPAVQWVLVLPPWGPLYHWQITSSRQKPEIKIKWSEFFDIESLSFYVPVIEFESFLKENGPIIDVVFYLQQEEWVNGGRDWVEKAVISDCHKTPPYFRDQSLFRGNFYGYEEIRSRDLHCVTTQGYSSVLKPLVTGKLSSVMFDHAEIVLHDNFGSADYWAARRSVRFASRLREIGDKFRRDYLDSRDQDDRTETHRDWRHTLKRREAIGGPYIAVHLRRRDFLSSRPKQVPSLKMAAKSLKKLQTELGIVKVFLATDAPETEVKELRKLVPELVQFIPDQNGGASTLLSGSVAIVEQWICAHARYFIGTFESTFSFRIQEEREILGFQPETTFNRLCGDDEITCQQPAKWKIVY